MDLTKTTLAIAFLLAAHKAAAQSAGNDVYNFYFQKGSAPQSVIQGGAGQAAITPAAPPPPLEAAPVVAAPNPVVPSPATPEAPRDWSRIELHLGPTRWSDEVGTATAYSAGIQGNFNRYLGARLQGHYLAVESAEYKRPIADRDQASNRYGGSAALVFTPLRMDLVGHKLVRISALAGLRSDRRFAQESFAPLEEQKIRTHLQGFVGASVGVALNENVGIEGSVAMVDGGKIGQATGSLVFSF